MGQHPTHRGATQSPITSPSLGYTKDFPKPAILLQASISQCRANIYHYHYQTLFGTMHIKGSFRHQKVPNLNSANSTMGLTLNI